MAVPKRKTSKSRVRTRKRSHKIQTVAVKGCPQCGEAHQPHRACPSCGYYKGRQVLTVEAN